MGKSGPLNYGNYNLKGKKHLLLNCKCCVCTDKREQMLSKTIEKELFEDPNEDPAWEEYIDFWELEEEHRNWKEYNQR